MEPRIKKILDCLNRTETRATYGAVRDHLGLSVRPNWGELLGRKCPYSSWIVRKSDGKPSGYTPEETHPNLDANPLTIITANSLEEFMDENEN